jgi:transcriptional regulator with XRE-family HTH domain
MQAWAEYVRDVAGAERQIDIAARTGIDQTTISRWLKDEVQRVTPRSVALFARGYDRPVLEAFVIAGLISSEDAQARVVIQSLDSIDDAALIAELARRHHQQQDARAS